jgi:hypothetical protein
MPDARRTAPWTASLLRDERDQPLLRVIVRASLVMLPMAAALFAWDRFPAWLALVYWTVWLRVFAHPIGHLMHRAIHRPVFNRQNEIWNVYFYWILSVVMGYTPTTFFIHHIAMHHIEENLDDDLSSTMRYQRDSFRDFLRYFTRFMLLNNFELPLYVIRKRKPIRFALLSIGGDLFHAVVVVGLALWRPRPTLVVFIVPFLLTRFVLAAINWTQHVFVDPDRPDDVFQNTTSTIDARFNQRAWNEGYHLAHHLRAGAHYSELAADYERDRATYGARDALVFDGVDFLGIWIRLMTGHHEALARHVVRLPGMPLRTDAEMVALLRRRLEPIRVARSQRAADESAESPAA